MGQLLGFPDPVNETSARAVAGGVVTMAAAAVVLDQPWILVPLTYGFAARVLTGPKLSPLGQVATRLVTPRIRRPATFSPGPPKRLAQAMGLGMSGTALVLHYGFGRKRAAYSVLGGLIGAAGLEAFLGYCLACKMFPTLVKLGIVPEGACEDCLDVSSRTTASPGANEPVEVAQAV
jgi:Domain of unknown function (DUF4395)